MAIACAAAIVFSLPVAASAQQDQGAGSVANAQSETTAADLVALVDRIRELQQQQRPAEALPLIAELQRELLAVGRSADAIMLTSWSAAAHRELGQYEAELADVQQGLQWLAAAEFAPDEHDRHLSALSELESEALSRLGRSHAAVAAAQRAVAAAADRPAGEQAWVCNNLAKVLAGAGEPVAAIAPYRRALALLPSGQGEAQEVRRNLAVALIQVGKPEAALRELDTVVAPPSSRLARLRELTRAYALILMSRFDEALAVIEELQLRTAPDAPAREVAMVAAERSRCLRALGQADAALALVTAALERLSAAVPGDDLAKAVVLRAVGSALTAVGVATGERSFFDQARAAHTQALEMQERLAAPAVTWDRIVLGLLLAQHFPDEEARAVELLQTAMGELEARRAAATSIDESDRADLFRRLRSAEFAHLDPYDNLAVLLARRGSIDAALEVVERGRARSGLDLIERGGDPLLAARSAAAARGDSDRVAAIDRLCADLDDARASAEVLRRQQSMPAEQRQRQQRAIEQAQAALQQRRRELVSADFEAATPASLDAIRAVLRPGQCMLVYLVAAAGSQVFVVPPAGEPTRVFELTDEQGHPLTRSVVEAQVTVFRAALGAGIDGSQVRGRPARIGSAPTVGVAGSRLFRSLVPAALWSELTTASLVYVVPHGALNLVPFEALVVQPGMTAADCVYWLDRGPPVAYGPSGSVLRWSVERSAAQAARPARGDVVVVAAPSFQAPDLGAMEVPASGVTVIDAGHGSAAARAGLQLGDVVVASGAVPAASRDQLCALLAAAPVTLRIWRAGTELDLDVDEAIPAAAFAEQPPRIAVPALQAAATPRRAVPALELLPGATREATAIASALSSDAGDSAPWPCVVRLGARATESALFELAVRARILHVASHQVDLDGSAWAAGRIVLSPPLVPSPDDDGGLEVDEVLARWQGRLRDCELVMISSCRSRLGALRAEEGVFGFPRAFQFAGCPRVLASLWPVDDDATAELMTAFYRGLRERPARPWLDVLASARRELRSRRPDPRLWAPFVWIGSSR